jgi:hypothetical protein
MSGPRAAVATSEEARAAADGMLGQGGSAVDAVVSGFGALAALHASVLCAPMVALVGGAGSSPRAWDGRPVQPGKGAPRPRGVREGAPEPRAARVGVPRSLGVIALLLRSHGRARVAEAARHGVELARKVAPDRADLLRDAMELGPLALVRRAELLVHELGALAGGNLTRADLEDAVPGEAAAAAVEGPRASVYVLPWERERAPRVELVLAADGWGQVAALGVVLERGVALPELDVELPATGEPVRRGVPRTPVGTVARRAPSLGLARAADAWLAFAGRDDPPAELRDALADESLPSIDARLLSLGRSDPPWLPELGLVKARVARPLSR